MEEIKKEKASIPPYVSYKTVQNFLERLKVGIPSRIDTSLMNTFSGTVQSQLISTLRYLNLITQHGTPTEHLTRLVNSEEHEKQKTLREIIKISYPFLFTEDVDLGRITPNLLNELFVSAGTSGGTTQKCIAFFTALAKDARIKLSPHINSQTRRVGTSKSRNKVRINKKTGNVPASNKENNSPTVSMTVEQVLLAKFPSFDPEWSDEVKSKWFDGFKDLMNQFKSESEEESEIITEE